MGSLQKVGVPQPTMHKTPNLGQEIPVSPLGSLNPSSSQIFEVDFMLLVKQDGIIVEGENEVVQQQSHSHMFHRTCCTPSPKPITSLRREVRQRRPPSRLIETIEGRSMSPRKPKGLLNQTFPREPVTMQSKHCQK
jgi:hypothetical protein